MFLGNSYISLLTFPDPEEEPAGEVLLRPHFGMHRFVWEGDDTGVSFGISHGEMIRLLRDSGFEVEDLVEIKAQDDAVTPSDPLATAEWSRKWSIEEVWKARKRS
jgi:hypothetical protein